jgi:hypothetical protein
MKKGVLILLILVLVSAGFSLEVDFDCPKSVVVDEDFECSLQVENFTGVYDIKVDISDEKKTLAEIWDDEWKSAYYYLYEFVDDEDEKEIKLRIVEDFEGDIKGILKLRQDGKREFFEFDIEIEAKDVEEEKEDSERVEAPPGVPSAEGKEVSEVVEAIKISEIIHLGSNIDVAETEDIKTMGEIIYESESEKIKKYSVFGFALLCVMLVVLVVMKKL